MNGMNGKLWHIQYIYTLNTNFFSKPNSDPNDLYTDNNIGTEKKEKKLTGKILRAGFQTNQTNRKEKKRVETF